jgi:alpha-L-fucosidase
MRQPNDKMDWMLDAKFGMFIHWGLYAGPARGEWHMHAARMTPGEYAKYAYPESGGEYFCADKYNPAHWAAVAKAAGMKWMCLTARHHDGFCLFDSPHPNAFTSVQTLGRDLVGEYIAACRQANLKTGVYYSPLSWRYPGYYDIYGDNCKDNIFGYATDPAHKENARLMKEENYANVKQLVTAYGKIDHIYWDGGWLSQQGTDADGAFFHESGAFLDPANPWPIDSKYTDCDDSRRPLGIMGLVRKYHPDAIVNLRYGWIGDVLEEEGGGVVTGPIRAPEIVDKCLSIHNGSWGYDRRAMEQDDILTSDEVIEILISCVTRNMVMLLNFGPDRHGQMPPAIEQRLLRVGEWLEKAGEAVYGTRGGPWQPVDGLYGYCYKKNILYVHISKAYMGSEFTLPPVGPLEPLNSYDVFTKRSLKFDLNDDRTVSISGIDRYSSPVDSIVAVEFDKDIMTYAREG